MRCPRLDIDQATDRGAQNFQFGRLKVLDQIWSLGAAIVPYGNAQ